MRTITTYRTQKAADEAIAQMQMFNRQLVRLGGKPMEVPVQVGACESFEASDDDDEDMAVAPAAAAAPMVLYQPKIIRFLCLECDTESECLETETSKPCPECVKRVVSAKK